MERFPPPKTPYELRVSGLTIRHCMEDGWTFVPEWPYRIENQNITVSGKPIKWTCERCRREFFLFWTDDRIWKAMHKSWWNTVLCTSCLTQLVDHPEIRRTGSGRR